MTTHAREPIRYMPGKFPEQAVPQDELNYETYSRVWVDGWTARDEETVGRGLVVAVWAVTAMIAGLVGFVAGLCLNLLSTIDRWALAWGMVGR